MIGLGCYENVSEEKVRESIITEYYVEADLVNKFEILLAWLDGGGYEETSYFLLRDKETKELFENGASHCSCAGFEDQFKPQATTVTYLKSEHFSSHTYATEVDTAVKKFAETL